MWEAIDSLPKQKLVVFVKKQRAGRRIERNLHGGLRQPLLRRHVPVTQETGNKSESVDKVGKAEADYKVFKPSYAPSQTNTKACVFFCVRVVFVIRRCEDSGYEQSAQLIIVGPRCF